MKNLLIIRKQQVCEELYFKPNNRFSLDIIAESGKPVYNINLAGRSAAWFSAPRSGR
jgi:hypothetical protein